MSETVLPDDEWVMVFYPTTGALRLHPSLDAAKHSISRLSWPIHIYKSPLDFQHRFDHLELEKLWAKVYKNVAWRFPRTAVGKVSEADAIPPDAPTDDFVKLMWAFFQRVGDRVTRLSIQQTRSKDHYELHINKMKALIADEQAYKEKYPKQARIIFTRLAQETTPYILEKDLELMMNGLVALGQLKTKQPAWRIFQYYRPQFIDDGFISRGSEGAADDESEDE